MKKAGCVIYIVTQPALFVLLDCCGAIHTHCYALFSGVGFYLGTLRFPDQVADDKQVEHAAENLCCLVRYGVLILETAETCDCCKYSEEGATGDKT